MTGSKSAHTPPMPSVIGYADRINPAAGDRLTFMIGRVGGNGRYRCRVVRLVSGDTGPKGPGLKEERFKTVLDGEHTAEIQHTDFGSYAIVDGPHGLAAETSLTLQAVVYPTRHNGSPQTIVGAWAEDEGRGLALVLDDAGAPALCLGDGHTREVVGSGRPLAMAQWAYVAATYDRGSGHVALYQAPLPNPGFTTARPHRREAKASVTPSFGAAPLMFGACRGRVAGGKTFSAQHFNGKIDRPSVAGTVLPFEALVANAGGRSTAAPSDKIVGVWDFSQGISTDRIFDRSPNHRHGRTVNAPKRAVTGCEWDGSERDWRHAPRHYSAIHFHDDDIYDCRWTPTFTLDLPKAMKSGVYALKIEAEGPPFYITFFVRPPRGTATQPIAFLASTATYLCYSNYWRKMAPGAAELGAGAMAIVDLVDFLLPAHPWLGKSTYDNHNDGSGVCHVSWRRPIVNVRPTGRIWNQLIDIGLIDWLETHGLACDVITDDDLHAEGLPLLEKYRVVLTGCHPEYNSLEMADAIDAYLKRGGRFMYMGGNGFYWRVSYPECHPGMIEIRRAEDGTRAWEEIPGEYHHSSTGELGGLWRRQERSPNLLVGVGFVAQGFDRSSYYRKTAAAADSRAAFIFAGIADEVVGDFGYAGDGAAGYEVDAWNPALGSPRHSLVVAASENHTNAFQLVNEEILVNRAGIDGAYSPAIRADMVFFETPNGGAVFSTGSISYIASLWHKGYDNNISKLTLNVLRRFLDPTPFVMPPA